MPISIGAKKVYAGPGGSIAYAEIGSLSTGDWYDNVWNEYGWKYIEYSIAGTSTQKRGYIEDASATGYPAGYQNGRLGKMKSPQDVYSNAPITSYWRVGSVDLGESVTVLDPNVGNNMAFIEYSTSSLTKRGVVPISAIDMDNATALAKMNQNAPTYSGPHLYDRDIGSLNVVEFVVVLAENTTMAYVEYNTTSGRKRGYVPLNTVNRLNTTAVIPGIPVVESYLCCASHKEDYE